MSTWIGKPGDRLSVREAQTVLADSLRLAARPSFVWLVGFVYPKVLLFPAIALREALAGATDREAAEVAGTLLPFLLPPLMLLVAGLARISSPWTWNECVARHGRVRLRDALAAGRGLLWSTFGLWICVLLLDLAVLGLGMTVFHSLGGQDRGWRAYLIGGPLLLFCCAYAAVVSVLFQLALHSLAQNRRGVVSALQHAWRLTLNDPWATLRATLVDCAISAVVALLALSDSEPIVITGVVLGAITGVARALYWGRVYRLLGGLTPEDGVPGVSAPALPG
ncbi:MAG: hypothetical protein ABI054_14630 [Planctomycetota bacterium]